MSAGSLAAGEDYAYIDGLAGGGVGILLEADFGKSVGIGEYSFDCFLIGHRLSGLAFYNFHRTGEGYRQLGLICCTGFL